MAKTGKTPKNLKDTRDITKSSGNKTGPSNLGKKSGGQGGNESGKGTGGGRGGGGRSSR